MVVNPTVSFDGIWWTSFFPSKDSRPVFAVPWGTVGEITRVCRHTLLFQVAQEAGVTRSFHRINMTGLFKRKELSLRLHVPLISAVRPSLLRLGCPTSSPQAALWEASGDCTLSKALYRFKVLAWHSPRRSLKVCATCSRWMIWHLKEMPTRKKAGTSRFSEFVCACVLWNLQLLCILQRTLGQVLSASRISLASSWALTWGASKARSPSEMPLFDLTGTGLQTESRDYTLSVEHKQTMGWIHCVRHRPSPCSHSLMALFDSLLTNKAVTVKKTCVKQELFRVCFCCAYFM